MLVKRLKDKRCKNPKCKKIFTPRNPFQPTCWNAVCPVEYNRWRMKKKLAADKKEERKRDKEKKEKLKTLSQYEADARVIFQRFIRYRDRDQPCISCGRTNTEAWDGGHYFDAGMYSGLIFHEDNCHKQCSRPCNKDLHGNKANYRIGLVNRIGEARVKWLEENKDRLRTYKYSKEELIEIKKKYNTLIKEMK